MLYADFNYYHDSYNGAVDNEIEFKRLMREASAFLDYISQGRCQDYYKAHDEDDKVKNAACAIVDIRKEYAEGERGITSETVGKVSVSYSAQEADKTLEEVCYQTAKIYLAGTGLLYLGVRPCEPTRK